MTENDEFEKRTNGRRRLGGTVAFITGTAGGKGAPLRCYSASPRVEWSAVT
jgi:hypothetical protein